MKAKYAPSERNARLTTRPELLLRRVLGHERHLQNLAIVGSLVTRLHRLRTPKDYYDLHYDLVQLLYEADEWRAHCADIELRLRAGEASGPSWSAVDWELERIVADRISRQLRAVGDGLAWKAFGYDRRLVVALASNRGNPNFYGKQGFWCELRVLQTTWEQEGHFSLLHDATNGLTIGDLTCCSALHAAWVDSTKHTCNSERFVISEVKNRNGQCMTVRRGKQLARMQMVVNAIVNDEPVIGSDGIPRKLFRSSMQFKTHLRQLEEILEEAWRTGHSVHQLQRHWVVSGRAPVQAMAAGLTRAGYGAKEDIALNRANIGRDRHRFLMSSADMLALSPALAPLSIYPFRPEICAALICDYLAFVSVLGIPALYDALLAAGFKEVRESTDIDVSQPDHPVISGAISDRSMSMNGSALQQVMLECVDIRRQAEAMREYCTRPESASAVGVLILQNERATWK